MARDGVCTGLYRRAARRCGAVPGNVLVCPAGTPSGILAPLFSRVSGRPVQPDFPRIERLPPYVYNIVNGFEGDRVDDPGSVYHGKHMRNGWKNLGLPWGYEHHPDLMWVEPED